MNITLDRNEAQHTGLLTVHLTEADYGPAVESQLKDYAKRAQIKGFRPGKVPFGMVKKMYGKGILADELNKVLGKAVDSYIKENNVKLLGEPLPVANNVDIENAKEFDFQFELGLLSDFELPADVNVDLHKVSLDDDTVAQTNEQISRQFGETTNPETSEAGDYLLGKLKKADEEGEGRPVLLPIDKVKEGQDKFVGAKADDVVTFDLSKAFGDAKAIAGFTGLSKKEAEEISGDYTFTVEKINRTAAPEMNQELFDKVFGPEAVSSQEEFDAKVREVIQENYNREAEGSLNNRLVEALVNSVNVTIPQEFFKKWLVRANEGKLTPEMVEEHYEDYEKELKWSLIRNKVVEESDLKVSYDEVLDRAMGKFASQFGMANMPEELRESMRKFADEQLRREDGKQYVQEYEAILAEKVLENLRGKVVVNDKPVTAEEFRDLHS
jgi:trigger factor